MEPEPVPLMSKPRGVIGTIDREVEEGGEGGAGGGGAVDGGGEGEGAMAVAENEVRHIFGGPAALPTALVTESGGIQSVYFGESRGDHNATSEIQPEAPPPSGDPPTTISATEALDQGLALEGTVVGASLGWQHALLCVK